ncbi:MAG: ImmA/IrrE family metallo-endopeptidase [Clostridia bacterium]|nr:ImmA/IrrE family metallo-endopeptidase [Clostridia bacterium]
MKWLSNTSIDELGNSLIKDYMSKAKGKGCAVDIEGFAANYLMLPIEYRSFAEKDMSKLGYISDGITPLNISVNGKIKSVIFPKGTIVIESCLRCKAENGRRRFTIAHESAHYIVDKSLAAANYHREFDCEYSYSISDMKRMFNINEAYVDRLAAAILMPEFMVRKYLKSKRRDGITIYDNDFIRPEDNVFLQRMAADMGTSLTAMYIRVRQLGLYTRKPMNEYLSELDLGKEKIK